MKTGFISTEELEDIDWKDKVKLTGNITKMVTANDRLLKDVGESIGLLHSKMSVLETQQYSIQHQICTSKLGKDVEDSLNRIIKFSVKVHADVIEGFYSLQLAVNSYIADIGIQEIVKDFVDEDGNTEEAGNSLNIELYDFTDGNEPKISELDY